MSDILVRDQIIDFVKKEIIGPNPVDIPGSKQPNGEEILNNEPPRIKYSAGILFPRETEHTELDDVKVGVKAIDDSAEDTGMDTQKDVKKTGAKEIMNDDEEVVNLSNAFNQSAISMTVCCGSNSGITVNVQAAVYHKSNEMDSEGKKRIKYYRKPIIWNKEITLPTSSERTKVYDIDCEGGIANGLKFMITNRSNARVQDIFTFSLLNSKVIKSQVSDGDCFFQVGYSLEANSGFIPIPPITKVNPTEDEASNMMLYRNEKSYATGHGCAADWCEDSSGVSKIWTEIIPTFDVKPIVPSPIDGVSLSMYLMSDLGNISEMIDELTSMVTAYRSWIGDLQRDYIKLDKIHHATAERHIALCTESADRMENGIELLKKDSNVLRAFRLMNRAMLMQQLHYNLPTSKWFKKGDSIYLEKGYDVMPKVEDKETWQGDKSRYGKWRPFQIAFVLMNLESMHNQKSVERDIVDLIWFPTGGGKTEAYLGLSAYTIFLRRLRNRNDAGTAILMRYTLRLLTAQQYQRAASLICSCEIIRNDVPEELGEERITIGLWVGETSTPNNMTDALSKYHKLVKEKNTENPFVMLKCPWCGAQMGSVDISKTEKKVRGYAKVARPKKQFAFVCDNEDCHFSTRKKKLPLSIIDDEIYSNPPTLLLGTVDKFAMLPFRPEAQTIFGINTKNSPPELIIQDELHLISGPLGTMVGHYETMINELCYKKTDDGGVSPKIIASTATISNAKEQCHALYNCGYPNVKQFPPQGLDAGESFFAERRNDLNGRKYVGIFAPASSSFAMTNIRLYATLLYAGYEVKVSDDEEKDPYWTNLGYFNSLRELGQTATWVNADIEEYLHTIYGRRYDKAKKTGVKNRRYIHEYAELTSRIQSEKIPESLERLSLSYPNSENKTVDICLATNMVSVGVDVPRLGLMSVTGQPKTTSEYIQATSRVGRSADAPGLVFVSYNPSRPRDKSHYEQFKAYHMNLYSQVEPTSVTPFSERVRERALHAVVIGLARLFREEETFDDPTVLPDEDTKKWIKKVILDRVGSIDSEEYNGTEKMIYSIFRHWELSTPQKFDTFSQNDDPVLMFASSIKRNPEWEDVGYATPTSMRSVDSSCEIKVITRVEED